MELFFLYVWMKLDNAIDKATAAAVVGFIISALFSVVWWIAYSEKYTTPDTLARIKKAATAFLIVGVVGATLNLILPTGRQVAVLVAGHYALKLSGSPEAAKVVTLVRRTANEMLDQQLKQAPSK